MSENRRPTDEQWEAFVQDAARDFPYPPTPDVSPAARLPGPRRTSSRWRLVTAALLLLAAALAVPEVRAAVLDILRVGVVRIFVVEPGSTLSPVPPGGTATPDRALRALDLPGETTLERVQARLKDGSILLPAALGTPDRVFLQYLGGPVVTLVWLTDAAAPEWVLQILDRRVSASKEQYQGQPQAVTVNGRAGVWLEDVHEIVFYGMSGEHRRLVEAHVLLWEIGGVTYRLETAHPLADALPVAESVR